MSVRRNGTRERFHAAGDHPQQRAADDVRERAAQLSVAADFVPSSATLGFTVCARHEAAEPQSVGRFMRPSTKGFLTGFSAAVICFLLAAFVWDGLRSGMLRSKSKRLLAQGSVINREISRYHEQHGAYPASKVDVTALFPRIDNDFDYFSDGKTCTLVCPSLTGQSRWEPYVFKNGRLAAWPSYMGEFVKQDVASPN